MRRTNTWTVVRRVHLGSQEPKILGSAIKRLERDTSHAGRGKGRQRGMNKYPEVSGTARRFNCPAPGNEACMLIIPCILSTLSELKNLDRRGKKVMRLLARPLRIIATIIILHYHTLTDEAIFLM